MVWADAPINTTSRSPRRPCTRSAGQVTSVCATANNARPREVNGSVRSIATSSAADRVMPLASSHCATATAAHKTPCQNRGTKSSSKAARAHSQNTTEFALDNASSNRPHHSKGRGKFGAEQIIEAAAPIASAAPSSAAMLSRRSRSARAAISRHKATAAPRKPRSIDIKPLLPTIGVLHRRETRRSHAGSLITPKHGRCRVGGHSVAGEPSGVRSGIVPPRRIDARRDVHRQHAEHEAAEDVEQWMAGGRPPDEVPDHENRRPYDDNADHVGGQRIEGFWHHDSLPD